MFSNVNVTSGEKKRLTRKTTGRKATSPCTRWGLFWNMLWAWTEGGGGERSQAPRVEWQMSRRARDTPQMKLPVLL